jgi:hypothetical protein
MCPQFDPTPLPEDTSYPVVVEERKKREKSSFSPSEAVRRQVKKYPWLWLVALGLLIMAVSPQTLTSFLTKNERLSGANVIGESYVNQASLSPMSLWKSINEEKEVVGKSNGMTWYETSEAYRTLDEIERTLAEVSPHFEMEYIDFNPFRKRKRVKSMFDTFFDHSLTSVTSPLVSAGSKARRFFSTLGASRFAMEQGGALSDERLYFGSKNAPEGGNDASDEGSSMFSLGGLEKGAEKALKWSGLSK